MHNQVHSSKFCPLGRLPSITALQGSPGEELYCCRCRLWTISNPGPSLLFLCQPIIENIPWSHRCRLRERRQCGRNGDHGPLVHLLMTLPVRVCLCPCTYYFHLMIKYFWICPTLSLDMSHNRKFMTSSLGCMVTRCYMVKCSVSIKARQELFLKTTQQKKLRIFGWWQDLDVKS